MVFANNRSLPSDWSAFQICEPLFLTRLWHKNLPALSGTKGHRSPLISHRWQPISPEKCWTNPIALRSLRDRRQRSLGGVSSGMGGAASLEIPVNSWVACSHFMNFATSKPPNLYPSAVTINNQHDQHPIPSQAMSSSSFREGLLQSQQHEA